MAQALNLKEMLQAEASAIGSGWSEARLLEAAGLALGQSIHQLHPKAGTAVAYLGKGHNAGDALVALKYLRDEYGWQVGFRAGYPITDCAPLVQEHATRMGPDAAMEGAPIIDNCRRPLILLDGLLGTGSKGIPRAPLSDLIEEMASLRENAGAIILAIDLPSGVDADLGQVAEGAVVADQTLMIANAKVGLLQSSCANFTGALVVVPVPILTREGNSGMELIAPQGLSIGKAPRPHDSHKGSTGCVRLLVGSVTYPGAAALASIGALRGGAGLVRLHVPNQILSSVRSLCPPEVIAAGYEHLNEVPAGDCDARVVGCGLGHLDEVEWMALKQWISSSGLPTVIDADALNAIAKHEANHLLLGQHVITPHPGEFKRLAPALAGETRETAARRYTDSCPATLLLKGSRSLIATSGQSLRCNATGNAGMASGGQGDLLAGVIGARLASGDGPRDAASLGAWLCGRAAERALSCQSPESLTATDTSHWLGAAWKDWREGSR